MQVERDWISHLKQQREQIIEDIARNLSRQHPELFSGTLPPEAVEHLIRQAVVAREDLAPAEHDDIAASVMGQATGYGPLQPYFTGLEAEEITEIFINPSPDGPRVFYSKGGRAYSADRRIFADNEEVTRYCQRICEDVGRPFNAESPIVDAWLKDGSRIAVMGFKVSPLGTAATIRKSPLVRPPMPIEALVRSGTFPPFVAALLVDLLVKGHANLGVFGRTDSGKTTVLRSLGRFIDSAERVMVAETSYELAFPHLSNCINLVEVSYGTQIIISMNELCKTTNRNNPDRAIVGEIRSKEVIAASQIAASTSGGFWTTGHAGDIYDLRSRIWGMFLDGGVQLPMQFLDEVIRSMFHFVIFLDKDQSGRRVLMSIVEVTPDGYRTIVRFDEEGFAKTKGQVRRWIYEQPVSRERLAKLAFRGADIQPEYEQIHKKYLQEE
ncbi:MAG: ATPase, T2SS/T4P/T4SS family [Bacillota bacterium]